MRINIIADAIEEAINKKCFLPALAMTLIIPDICGQFDYPEIYRKEEEYNTHKGQGAAYEKWYDENIYPYEKPNFEKSDMNPEQKEIWENIADKTTLTGHHLWKLRCEFLHNASIDLDKEISDKNSKVTFKLIATSSCDYKFGGASSCGQCGEDYDIELDVVELCRKILSVLKNKYLENEDFRKKTDIKHLNFEIIK